MKRYIRLKDGRIIDTTKNTSEVFGETDTYKIVDDNIVLKKHWSQIPSKYDYCSNSKYEVVGIATTTGDDILDLIQVGDLVRIKYDYMLNEVDITMLNGIKELDEEIFELYTLQGRNYIFVAEKIKDITGETWWVM